MQTIEIIGENYFGRWDKTRAACRGIVIKNGLMLMSYAAKEDTWMIPGGGLEAGETPETCCVRETEEETGLIVRPLRQFLTLYEYYEEYRYISYYFVCEVTGSGQMRLTDAEKRRGLEPRWIPLRDAVDLFSRHESWADISEEKRGSYLREYTALREYLDSRDT